MHVADNNEYLLSCITYHANFFAKCLLRKLNKELHYNIATKSVGYDDNYFREAEETTRL